ncbi:MAG: PD-(D/E)XK nuclease family protein [Proteobacteria bacterium]|nr:PD-(D/E)XK nuclease family protein [Candidatus Enterousia scatequi]
MVSNNRIFYATNPARMLDALWILLRSESVDLSKVLIFLPSRRAVRAAEKMLVAKNGGALVLPRMVALGEGADSTDDDNVVTTNERVMLLAKLLAADPNIKNISLALPIAHDFVNMADYMENEGIAPEKIDWNSLVDDKYAQHFKSKADLLCILTSVLPTLLGGRVTQTRHRNACILDWIDKISQYDLVVVCGSTASVPVTADLMAHIANAENGRIILSGMISGDTDDFVLNTNPYNAEYQFLMRIGVDVRDINKIDVGPSAIEFFNFAFGNNTINPVPQCDISHCHLVSCFGEAEEAASVADITAKALSEHKTVMIITPDAAANQRIASEFSHRNIIADFSAGIPATRVAAGRAMLNMLDGFIDTHNDRFDSIYAKNKYNLFDTISELVKTEYDAFCPTFLVDDKDSMVVWQAIKDLSDVLSKYSVVLKLADVRVFIYDALSGVSVRENPIDDARVVVLGTIEARMQTADVVILTGLNEGMFPSYGYANNWLPSGVSEQIGLPSKNKKVSLMALDFMNLSCSPEVYWLRSATSGGVQTTESRFLSRVVARGGNFDRSLAYNILSDVRGLDIVEEKKLDYSSPVPPADWSDVYVTELELLIHNPYAFYVRHILRLKPKDDYWALPDARAFGNLVHSVIEKSKTFDVADLVRQMDSGAREILGTNHVVYRFWHKRFVEIAQLLASQAELLQNSVPEIAGAVKIAGRNVRARADRVWDGGVLDIKTGAAPNRTQLLDGNMPQLPLEAFILQSGGFNIKHTNKSKTPVMLFLQLQNNNVKPIEYDAVTTKSMIDAAIEKTTQLFNMYSAGQVPYEYYENNEPKYKMYDDLARRND